MTIRCSSVLRVTSVLLIAQPVIAHATPITFAFEGTVGFVQTELSSSFAVGDPVTGTLTFDAVPDLVPSVPTIGMYNEAISSLSLSIGAKTYTLGNGTGPTSFIQVRDNYSGDSLDSYSFGGQMGGPGVAPNLFARLFEIGLSNTSDPSAIVGDALPTADLALANLPERGFDFDFGVIGGGPNYSLTGVLTKFEAVPVSSVPEPASASLLCLGLAFLVATTKLSRR